MPLAKKKRENRHFMKRLTHDEVVHHCMAGMCLATYPSHCKYMDSAISSLSVMAVVQIGSGSENRVGEDPGNRAYTKGGR